MKRLYFLSILFYLILNFFELNIHAQENTIPENFLSQISALSNVNIANIDLELKFTQPIDHKNPVLGSFEQRIYLKHKDFSKPVVLWIEGYAARGNQEQEITRILDANQVLVEHRYFGESKPDSLDWQYLTIRQSAADHHRIVETFKKLYTGKWVNSGISKGGQTTMYHRRFYPDDVDASVCYVGPLNFSDEEPRVYSFLESVGDADTRQKILEFQKLVLEKKQTLMPLFNQYCEEKEFTFKIGNEAAFEYCVLEYSFAFWQWHKFDSDDIRNENDNIKDIFDHFVAVADPYFFSDQGIEYFAPFFYQALTQIGFYGYDITPFKDLFQTVTQPSFQFSAPEGIAINFDPESMQDINNWITSKGNNMIFIYGELDPWSASAVNLNGETNSLKMVLDEGDHRTRIKDFPDDQKEDIYGALENWLNISLER